MAREVVFAVVAVSLIWFISRLLKMGSREPNLPPGPPTIPLLGNLHVFPKKFAHTKYLELSLLVEWSLNFYFLTRFTEWAKVYGEIYSVRYLSIYVSCDDCILITVHSSRWVPWLPLSWVAHELFASCWTSGAPPHQIVPRTTLWISQLMEIILGWHITALNGSSSAAQFATYSPGRHARNTCPFNRQRRHSWCMTSWKIPRSLALSPPIAKNTGSFAWL